jgi:hypothetical protein
MKMLFECYLRNGIVYIPTVGRVDEGFYRSIDPVTIVPVSDTMGLQNALRGTMTRGNPNIANLPGSELVLPRSAGVKTWTAFARGALTWNIREQEGTWQIIGQRKRSDRGWENDPNQIIALPTGAGVDEVCNRLISVLQAKTGNR